MKSKQLQYMVMVNNYQLSLHNSQLLNLDDGAF